MAKVKLEAWIMWIVAILVSLGIGGLFVNGTFTTTFLLSYLPLIVHQIVGYGIIVLTIIGAVRKLFL